VNQPAVIAAVVALASRGIRAGALVCAFAAGPVLQAQSKAMVAPAAPIVPERTYSVAVASEGTDEIAIISFGPGGASVTKTVAIGLSATDPDGPHGLAVSPDREFYYVSTAHGTPYGSLWKLRARDNAEEAGTCAACRPVKVGVLFCAGMDLCPVGENDIKTNDALASEAKRTAVPAKAALQQETAETDIGRMCDWEEEADTLKRAVQIDAPASRSDARGPGACVNDNCVQSRKIDEHSAVAQMVLRPAMAARAKTDPVFLLARELYCRDDVGVLVGLNVDVGPSPRIAPGERGGKYGCIKPLVATAQGSAFAARSLHGDALSSETRASHRRGNAGGASMRMRVAAAR
jgi:hypothetical protein